MIGPGSWGPFAAGALVALLGLSACGGDSEPELPGPPQAPEPRAPELRVTAAFEGYRGTCSAPSLAEDGKVFLLCNLQYADLYAFSARPGAEFGERLGSVYQSWYGFGWSTEHAPSVFFSDDFQLARFVTTSLAKSQRDGMLWRYTTNPETGWLENPQWDYSRDGTERIPSGEGMAMSSDGRFFLWVSETPEGDRIQSFGHGVLDRPDYAGSAGAAVVFAAQSSDAYIAPAGEDAQLFRWSLERKAERVHGPLISLPVRGIGRLASNPEGTLIFAGSDWDQEGGLAIEVLERDPLSGELTPGFARLEVTPELCPECVDPQAGLEWLAVDARGDVYAATAVPYDPDNENPRGGVTAIFRWRHADGAWELDIAQVDMGREANPGFYLRAFALGDRPGVLLATAYARTGDIAPSRRNLGPFARIEILDDRTE